MNKKITMSTFKAIVKRMEAGLQAFEIGDYIYVISDTSYNVRRYDKYGFTNAEVVLQYDINKGNWERV